MKSVVFLVAGAWLVLGTGAWSSLHGQAPVRSRPTGSVVAAEVRAATAEQAEAFSELMRRGDALQKSGQNGAAREVFEAAVAKAVSAREKAAARLRVALTFPGESEVALARVHLERILEIPGLETDQRSEVQLLLAKGHVADYNSEAAVPLLEEIISSREVGMNVRAGAMVLRAQIHARYGVGWAWEKVRADCDAVLGAKGVSGQHRIGAHMLLVEALLAQRQFPAARESMRWLVGNEEVSPVERARQQLSLARTILGEGHPREAGAELPLARSLLERSRRSGGAEEKTVAETRVLAARCELLHGLVLCESGKSGEAREVLERVGSMPGQTAASPEAREAALTLRLRGLARDAGPCLKVLMVGSSLTIRGNIPFLIEQMAASAPEGSPRIVAGEHVRMGTGIRAFWMEGEAPDTVRHKIRTESWDVVVVETFYRMTEADIEQYVRLYADLARERGARVVMYETPASKLVPYPAGFESVHRANVNVGARLGVPVAPGLWAWKELLGAAPGKSDFDRFYSDSLHATLRGAYVNACCVYAAVTGSSPVGLFHPGEIAAGEARALQEAAWDAYGKTRSMTARNAGR